MTGRGIHYRDKQGNPIVIVMDANDAAEWLRDFAAKVTIVELDKSETLGALRKAQSQSVQGARVYDYAHVLASDKAGAEVVLTRNVDHFQSLTRARVEWP